MRINKKRTDSELNVAARESVAKLDLLSIVEERRVEFYPASARPEIDRALKLASRINEAWDQLSELHAER